MKMQWQALVAAGIVVSLHSVSAGDVTGKITLKGNPPPEREIDYIRNNIDCTKLHPVLPKTKFFVVGKDGELADVVVYLKGEALTGKTFPPPAKPAVMDQKDCSYVPQIMVIQTGQTLQIKNSDTFMHNVHTIPKDPAIIPFNRAEMANQTPPIQTVFSKPELFLKFQCDVHSWMFAWVSVIDHPYFALSDKDGSFKIPNVPPGKYTIVAVHRKAHPDTKGVSKEITVGADGAKTDFVVELK